MASGPLSLLEDSLPSCWFTEGHKQALHKNCRTNSLVLPGGTFCPNKALQVTSTGPTSLLLFVWFCFCHLELHGGVIRSEARILLGTNKSHIHSVIKYFEGLLCARLACVRSGYYVKQGEILLVHSSSPKKKKRKNMTGTFLTW